MAPPAVPLRPPATVLHVYAVSNHQVFWQLGNRQLRPDYPLLPTLPAHSFLVQERFAPSPRWKQTVSAHPPSLRRVPPLPLIPSRSATRSSWQDFSDFSD